MRVATMEYDVFFMPGYDWTYGGKLPGLCGYDCPVGCSTVAPDRGWSNRLMWRSNGRMVTYTYYPDKPKVWRCGEDWNWSKGVVGGKWYTIRMTVKMNTPGAQLADWPIKPPNDAVVEHCGRAGVADGESKAWLDGVQVVDRKNIKWTYKSDPKYGITRAYLTTYVGGSTVSMFAPDQDQYIKCGSGSDNWRQW